MEKCPNDCVDGFIFDPYTHKKRVCEYCRDLRKEEIKKSDFKAELRLPNSVCGKNIEITNIISKTYIDKFIDIESINRLSDYISELVDCLTLSKLPNESVIFNFGKSCNDANFITPFMLRAYESGLTVAPLQNSFSVIKALKDYCRGDGGEGSDEYNKLVTSDICLISIVSGTTIEQMDAIKGLMQIRGYSNLPTILITHAWKPYLSVITRAYAKPDDEKDKDDRDLADSSYYSLAKRCGILYINGEDEETFEDGRLSLDKFLKK